MKELIVQLSITSIRNRGKLGGAIFSGKSTEGRHYVILCDHKLIPDANVIDKGQQWHVRGIPTIREFSVPNCKIREVQIVAIEAELIKPAGRNMISWIAGCSECRGIGQVKASKLYERFGAALIDHIERKETAVLSELISEECAHLLCLAFEKHKIASTLLWLDQMGVPRKIGAMIVAYYKDEAQAKIEANPYVLTSFEVNWRIVDNLARRFGIYCDDRRRLESAVEECLNRGIRNGSTCLPRQEISEHLTKLLGSSKIASKILLITAAHPRYVYAFGSYQSIGMNYMETYLATRLQSMIAGEDASGQNSLFAKVHGNHNSCDAIVSRYESMHRLTLSPEQRNAVLTCVGAHVSLILGGAGTGKTTLLKVLYSILEDLQPGITIYQIALAGRAAQRMLEATGRESMTIAGFLTRTDPGSIDGGAVIVVDEMSMVDVILMYRLLRNLATGVKLILVGDPSQLPPIGPGLVLHSLAGIPSIPQTELKVIQRQAESTGIPQVAAEIRCHCPPEWGLYVGKSEGGVSFVGCVPAKLDETVEMIYAQLGGDGTDFSVQILSVTKSGFGGVEHLNAALHRRYRINARQILCANSEFGMIGATTLDRIPLKIGDLVMYTENDYELGLRNGSLGRIIAALPVKNTDDACCVCDFEGVSFELTVKHIETLIHAYSITVHKSQGSQFERVIIPIRDSRLLDQAMIYTAVTRGVHQVVLVGDEEVLRRAIIAPARAAGRHTNLASFLRRT